MKILKSSTKNKISVLMAVHFKDSPEHFASALDSLKPFVSGLYSTIIVADGPLTNQLEKVINKRIKSIKIELIKLSISRGLGQALNVGVKNSKSDFLLRMDADDLSRPERLDVLLDFLHKKPNVDVIGSYIAEFNIKPSKNDRIRKVPLDHNKIVKQTKIWCAMNHVTCLLRKESILKVGGYQGGKGFSEDWWLWARLIQDGATFINIKKVLVDVRIDNGFIKRRSGFIKFKEDLRLAQMMYKINFINWYHFIIIFASRLFQRLAPSFIVTLTYFFIRKL